MQPPDVDFRLRLSLAQSASENVLSMLVGFCQGNFLATLGLNFKYRFNLFSCYQSPMHGALLLHASSLAGKLMSGRSGERYLAHVTIA